MSVAKVVGPVVSASMAIMASQAMARVASDSPRHMTVNEPSAAVELEARVAMTKPSYRAAMADVVEAISRSYGEGGISLDDHLVQIAVSCPQNITPCDTDASGSPVDKSYTPDTQNGPAAFPGDNGGPYVKGSTVGNVYCYSNCYSACYGNCYSK